MENPYEPTRSNDWMEGYRYGHRIGRHRRTWEMRVFVVCMSGVIYEHVRDIVWVLKNMTSPNANLQTLLGPLAVACLVAWFVHLIEKNF